MSDTDTTNSNRRQPGRPYFEDLGGRHLAEVLERENNRPGKWDGAGMAWAACDTDDNAAVIGTILAELGEAIRAAGALFGPGVLASITGAPLTPNPGEYHAEPLDRLGRLHTHVGRLESRLSNAAAANAANAEEVKRLEHELATAQAAYDIVRAHTFDLTQFREAAHTRQAFAEPYLRTIEAALERAVGKGKASEIRRRARRNATKAAETNTDAAPDKVVTISADLSGIKAAFAAKTAADFEESMKRVTETVGRTSGEVAALLAKARGARG